MAVEHLVNPDLSGSGFRELWAPVCAILERFEPNWVERGGHDHARRFLARIVAGDPSLRLELVVTTPDDEVLALSLATLEWEGTSKWVFCQIGWVEQGQDRHFATHHIDDLKDWGRAFDARWIVYSSRRSPGAMERRFKTTADGSVLHRIPIKGPE